MMNLVYDHFTEGTTKDLFIEAATERENIRLSVADELFSNARKPVIISTVSIVLQNQLVEKIYH